MLNPEGELRMSARGNPKQAWPGRGFISLEQLGVSGGHKGLTIKRSTYYLRHLPQLKVSGFVIKYIDSFAVFGRKRDEVWRGGTLAWLRAN
jgi:hypothetical protein